MAKWLFVSDVVQLLRVPEATIYRWVRQGDIPCVVRSGKYYFNQSTLFSWAESKHINIHEYLLENKENVKTDLSNIIDGNKKIISLFAGSRTSETNILLPILIDFIKLMNEKFNEYNFIFHATDQNIDFIKDEVNFGRIFTIAIRYP